MKSFIATVVALAAVMMMMLLAAGNFASATVADMQAIMNRKEHEVKYLAHLGDQAAQQRCSRLSNCKTKAASYCTTPACNRNLPASLGYSCNSNFGTDSDRCGCDNLVRSLTDSVVRRPHKFSQQRVAEFACFSKTLDSQFQNSSSGLNLWQYMGHESGAIRVYPGAAQERNGAGSCSNYDSRRRPWYNGAAGGAKDVIIIFENSRYMKETWADTRCALMDVIGSLQPSDFFTLIGYNSVATNLAGVLAEGQLMRAIPSNIRAMQQKLVNWNPDGSQYNDRLAIDMAFSLLRNTAATSNCQKHIQLWTEGLTQSSLTNSRITEGQSTLPANNKAKIFGMSIYSSSEGGLDHHLKTVSCAHNGIWTQVRGNALDKLRPYFQYLSLGVTGPNLKTSWSLPYLDAFGAGEVITVSYAVTEQIGTSRLVTGVMGVDVKTSTLLAYATKTEIENEIKNRGATCPTFSVDSCTLQLIREQTGFTCPSPQPSLATCKGTHEVFSTACPTTATFNDVTCTGENAGGSNDADCCPRTAGCSRTASSEKPPKPILCPGSAGGLKTTAVAVMALVLLLAVFGMIL